jgi:hypothetical protein
MLSQLNPAHVSQNEAIKSLYIVEDTKACKYLAQRS